MLIVNNWLLVMFLLLLLLRGREVKVKDIKSDHQAHRQEYQVKTILLHLRFQLILPLHQLFPLLFQRLLLRLHRIHLQRLNVLNEHVDTPSFMTLALVLQVNDEIVMLHEWQM